MKRCKFISEVTHCSMIPFLSGGRKEKLKPRAQL